MSESRRPLRRRRAGLCPPARRSRLRHPTMRWFVRRLGFYVFAHLGRADDQLPAAAADARRPDRRHPPAPQPGAARRRTPGSSRRTRRCSAAATTRSGRTTSLPRTGSRTSTSASRPRTTRRRSPRSSAGRSRTRSSSSASRSCSRSSSARRSGWSPRGGAAASSTTSSCPLFMALGAFPAFFTALLGALLPRAEARLVPDPARLRQRRRPRASTGRSSRARSATRSCRSS